jgi:DNA modification methylase
MKKQLYFGDNINVLRDQIQNESIDLIYLDPPFNSKRDYNLLFKSPKASTKKSTVEAPMSAEEVFSDAQITAFEDTWHWGEQAESEYRELLAQSNTDVSQLMTALRTFLRENDMMAYLTCMAIRLIELHRVLKANGSLYLHCDPTASHYLKILLDAVFGKGHFRSEIIWRRTGAHNKSNRWAPIHDTIFFYTKSDQYTWNTPRRPYMLGHVKDNFVQRADGSYRTNYYGNVLTGSGTRKGESGLPWKGFDPTSKGRHWAIPGGIWEEVGIDPSKLTQHQKLDLLFSKGFIRIEKNAAWPIYERTIEPSEGPAASDIWAYQPYTDGTVFGTDSGIDEDVSWIKPQDKERLGYPTQKPIALLERIVAASSNEGDIVLDPFCGCGTALDAAQKLKRQWIGIDITHLSIGLIERRLKDRYPALRKKNAFEITGRPKDLATARRLAEIDKYQFQFWALSLIAAQPFKGGKKGADGGIDGLIFPEVGKNKTEKIVVSVKGGENVGVLAIRDLIATVQREKAAIGVLITLTPPTKAMKSDALAAGFYASPHHGDFPKIQILTIEGLLTETERMKFVDMSYGAQTFKAAQVQERSKRSDTPELF